MAGVRRLRIHNQLLRVRDEPEPSPSGAAASVPPLLCIHGAGMSSALFIDTLRRYAPGRRVIAPDLPGHGQSVSRPPVSLELYRDTLIEVCDALDLSRVVLVGHSLGAAIALSLAAVAPGRVAGLVLLNGAAQLQLPGEYLAIVQEHAAAASLPHAPPPRDPRPHFVDRTPDAFADLLFSPSVSPDLRARHQAVLWSADAATLVADFALCRGLDLRPTIAGLSVPTLCLAGADDLLVPPSLVADTAALLPAAETGVIARSAHLSHLEQPAEVFARLDDFLGRIRS
jgi:pimeloyl-ACP methyl ester carboxylesterase